MCENAANITFCTCEIKPTTVHNKNSRRAGKDKTVRETKSYRWSLHKITGLSEQTMDGLLIEPDHAFSKELTADTILKELNERNCFDFTYEPNAGDSLGISENGGGKFISFIFENGKWIIGSPNPFTHQVTKFHSGSVKFE
jgi:hypothetical protein